MHSFAIKPPGPELWRLVRSQKAPDIPRNHTANAIEKHSQRTIITVCHAVFGHVAAKHFLRHRLNACLWSPIFERAELRGEVTSPPEAVPELRRGQIGLDVRAGCSCCCSFLTVLTCVHEGDAVVYLCPHPIPTVKETCTQRKAELVH